MSPIQPTPTTSFASGPVLVIGYGNELRSDDAVGPRVAAAVAGWNLPGVRSIAVHQLTPELAEAVASARGVIFVDAALGATGEEVRARRVEPAASPEMMAHTGDPRVLLELARAVFGHCPPAWSISVPAFHLEFGGELSLPTSRGLETALEQIRVLYASLPPVAERQPFSTSESN